MILISFGPVNFWNVLDNKKKKKKKQRANQGEKEAASSATNNETPGDDDSGSKGLEAGDKRDSSPVGLLAASLDDPG